MSTAIRYVRRDGRYEVWRGDVFYGTVQNTGTKWAGYRTDGACIGTARTRAAIAWSLIIG